MTYYKAGIGLEKPSRILCNDCAEKEVTFTTYTYPDGEKHHQQDAPWRWAKSYGTICDNCGTQC